MMTNKSTPLAEHIKPYKIKESEVYDYINMILKNSSKYKDLNRIFAEKAMLLSASYKTNENKNLERLSEFISKNLYVFSDCIYKLRSHIIEKKDFRIKLDDCNSVKKYMVQSMFNDFSSLGMINNYSYDSNSNTINGSLKENKEFFYYITGGFYEIFAYCEAKKVLDELSEAYGVDYELYRNVYVHIPEGNHKVETRELDLVIRFDDKVYIVEVKSGSTHKIRNYYTLRKRLGIDTFCSMLLIPFMKDNNISKVEDEFGICVADSYCFATNLSKMIKERFLSDETYDDYLYWQGENDINNYDSQDFMCFLDEDEKQSYYDNGFDEGFRQGYITGESDSGSQFQEYRKHIASLLLLSERFSEKEIACISSCAPETIEALKERIREHGWDESKKQFQQMINA